MIDSSKLCKGGGPSCSESPIAAKTRPAVEYCEAFLSKLCKAARAFRVVVLLMVLSSFSIDALAQAGYVHALSGTVFGQDASRGRARLRVGDTFAVGTFFDTGDSGRVVLKFADGQVVVLGPNSTARADRCRYDPRNIKAGSLAIRLMNGSMRFVAGAIAAENREAACVSVGESTITILSGGGVDFTVVVDTRLSEEVGVAAVTAGEIAVRTPYGPISRIEADEAAPWRPGRGGPQSPVPLDATPALIQAAVAALRLTALPSSAPVVVEPAARAARVVAELETTLAALPPTAAGPAENASPSLAVNASTFPASVFPGTPLSSTVTPAGGGCVGSPC